MIMIKLFGDFPKRWPRMNTQRERKLGKFDSFTTFICLENIVDKFERFSHNLMKNKKEARVSDK